MKLINLEQYRAMDSGISYRVSFRWISAGIDTDDLITAGIILENNEKIESFSFQGVKALIVNLLEKTFQRRRNTKSNIWRNVWFS